MRSLPANLVFQGEAWGDQLVAQEGLGPRSCEGVTPKLGTEQGTQDMGSLTLLHAGFFVFFFFAGL